MTVLMVKQEGERYNIFLRIKLVKYRVTVILYSCKKQCSWSLYGRVGNSHHVTPASSSNIMSQLDFRKPAEVDGENYADVVFLKIQLQVVWYVPSWRNNNRRQWTWREASSGFLKSTTYRAECMFHIWCEALSKQVLVGQHTQDANLTCYTGTEGILSCLGPWIPWTAAAFPSKFFFLSFQRNMT